jgi:hypothetical protein
MRTGISAPLRAGGFALHDYVGRLLRIGFCSQCIVLAALSAVAVLIASTIDHSLILGGRNVGLFQHPTIWTFIGLQIALPLSLRSSLNKAVQNRARIRAVLKSEGGFTQQIVKPLQRFLRLQDADSKLVATIIYCVGLAAFVWNTYQNQLPGIVVPYDFWDSKNYSWGFWVTRVYKLYLFTWLLPYIALIHIGILVVVLRFVRRNRKAGKLTLLPFHPDGVGGLGFVPTLVTTPVIVTLLICSVSLFAAFEVHRALDVTPLLGLTVVVGSAAIAYVVPILFLRSDIVALKRDLADRLMSLQQAYYSSIIERPNLDFDTLRKGNEALDYFGKVSARVEAISNYPHLKRVLKFTGLALTPSIISICLSLYDHLSLIITSLSKRP